MEIGKRLHRAGFRHDPNKCRWEWEHDGLFVSLDEARLCEGDGDTEVMVKVVEAIDGRVMQEWFDSYGEEE